MKLYFVTGNENKLREARELLEGFTIEQIILEDLPEIQGEPEQIAKEKARVACEKTGKTVFVEDTALCFNAWNGLPGPYVKDFVKKVGVETFPKLVSSFEDKTAVALVTIGFCEPKKRPLIFQGRINGRIEGPRGETKFDWDKVFVPEGYNKTLAEMTPEEKNKISHRKLAFENFKKWLKEECSEAIASGTAN